ncbi:UvrD-helicase domain-containing protein [Anaerobacillus sp. MEB173]|uniref:UvrD-helicase domain-containing protein n=1 Tax=Anaerobacillus sp. MEB173 TaxID=3383345 RepID=UPI003F8E0751
MTELQLVDQKERELIANELNTNFLVEAGAGSGKTFSLVQRMVNLIITGTYRIGEIVAITFTRKAADELKERFRSKLEQTRIETEDTTVRERIERSLEDFDQCYLGTVHAFCARLLRERPIEAGLDFDFNELDENEDRLLTDEAWDRYIQQVRLQTPEQLEELQLLGIDVAELRNNLHHLREYADVEWQSETIEKPSLDEAFQALVKFVNYCKPSLPDTEPDKGYDTLQKKLLRTIMQLKYTDHSKEKFKVAMLRPYQKKSTVTLNKWKSKDDAKEIRDSVQIELAEIVAPSLQSWYEYCHGRLIPFLKPALSYYEKLKKERSQLNFQDLLSNTARLLKENSEVRSYFQKKYRCLLVDEFQDTDPIQAEMMLYLTGLEIEEKNWTKLTPRQGSLFVVGDPKQSIYRFRRADIDIYQRVKDMIASTGGQALNLTMNFRTLDVITEPLNTVFQQHLPEQESTYQAAYRPLNSVKKADDGAGERIGLKKITVPYARKKADVIDADADAIARYIKEQVDQSAAQPSDFMVLTRYNDGLDVYAGKLEEYGIPVITTGQISLAGDRELQSILQLLTLLAQPTQSLYMVAVLRSPLIGISDKQLYHYKMNGGVFSLFANIPESLDENDRSTFDEAFTKLRRYYQWRINDLPSTVIEKVLTDAGILALYVRLGKSKREYARLYQVLEKVRAYEANGHSEFHEVVLRLRELIEEEEIEEMSLPDEENAVRVMNVHKSKGLEAPIVFLAHPNKVVEQSDKISQHIKREETDSIGYFTFTNEKGDRLAQPVDWEMYQTEEFEYLKAEETRLVYVAATRAEKMLVISGMDKNNEKNNPWYELLIGLQLEELAIPENVEKPRSTESESVSLPEYIEIKTTLPSWSESLTTPTYQINTPTESTEQINLRDVQREAGGGKDWGSLIHETFEACMNGIVALEHIIHRLLEKFNISKDRYDDVVTAIEQFKQTSIWERSRQVEQCFAELPFTYKTKSDNENQDLLLTGIIDLIFKEDDQWVIVDYKTDHVKRGEDVEKLTNYYAKQLNMYKDTWEKMTGERVKEVILYFVTDNQIVTL